MAVDIYTVWTNLGGFINENNTTTSTKKDVSSGLAKRVQIIYTGYSKIPVPNILYPCIFVELKTKSKDWSLIGNAANRNNIINFDIVSVCEYGLGQTLGRNKSDIEMIKLSDNIETLLDAYPKFSNTSVSFSKISNTNYDEQVSNDTYNSISRITLEVHLLTR